jgi:hypothetical protein
MPLSLFVERFDHRLWRHRHRLCQHIDKRLHRRFGVIDIAFANVLARGFDSNFGVINYAFTNLSSWASPPISMSSTTPSSMF